MASALHAGRPLRTGVAIVGAGVIGAAVAYEFARHGVDTVVLEAASGPATGASGANSGIIHTGFDSDPASFETQMILAHGQRWQRVFDELSIPYKTCGAVMLALTLSEAAQLGAIAANAERNGIKVRPYDKGQLRHLEPRAKAQGGLLIPDEAITDPYAVVERLLASAGEVHYDARVTHIDAHEHGVLLHSIAGDVTARFAINCAGLFADELAADRSFSITPRRGEFVVYAQDAAPLTDHILLPVPQKETKGILVFPTVYGYLCAGPTAVDQTDKNDLRVDQAGLAHVRAAAAKLLPRLAEFSIIDSWAGLRTVGHPRNYIVEWSVRVPNLFHVAGIRSTGLSACLGLSAYVVDRCRERGLTIGAQRAPAKPAPTAVYPWWQRRGR